MASDRNESAIDALATRLGRRMAAAGTMITTVESCTGGLIARALTETPGSSQWFDRGFVTYSNAAKSDMVGVLAQTLERFGAVSEPTALEMARGALARSVSQLALSVTGVAGPGGGSPDKPVGTVCFGWAGHGFEARAVTVRFAGDRASVRQQAALYALQGAWDLLPA